MKTFNKKNLILNQNLISRNELNEGDVSKLSKLHHIKWCFFNLAEKLEDKNELKSISEIITQIEFQLQNVWKFNQDSVYHKFWEIPKCSCPKMDNEEVYGTGHRYINTNCLYHGN
jgi:hypothetical protein